MAINTALDFLNPQGLLNGQTVKGDGQTGLQSAVDTLNHVFFESATVLLQWPARVESEGITLDDSDAADPGDAILQAYVRQPADRESWSFAVRASTSAGTLDVSLHGSTDGEIARVQFDAAASTAERWLTDTATVTTAAQTLTVKVFTSGASDVILNAVILYLDDETP